MTIVYSSVIDNCEVYVSIDFKPMRTIIFVELTLRSQYFEVNSSSAIIPRRLIGGY